MTSKVDNGMPLGKNVKATAPRGVFFLTKGGELKWQE
jgi:hypothetical protein